jgi:hypothetical protein
MSDTPETDAAALASDWGWSLVLKETCRRLERERDKAEAGWSECREFAQRVVDERNMARKETKEAWEEIAEACQDWLDSIVQEPAVDFIKAIRDWAKRKANGK